MKMVARQLHTSPKVPRPRGSGTQPTVVMLFIDIDDSMHSHDATVRSLVWNSVHAFVTRCRLMHVVHGVAVKDSGVQSKHLR